MTVDFILVSLALADLEIEDLENQIRAAHDDRDWWKGKYEVSRWCCCSRSYHLLIILLVPHGTPPTEVGGMSYICRLLVISFGLSLQIPHRVFDIICAASLLV